MAKTPTTTYFSFRIMIPGVWASSLVYLHQRIYYGNTIGGILPDAVLIPGLFAFGIFLGIIIHYIIDYSRRSVRFRQIEKSTGPIHFLIQKCGECQHVCHQEKSYQAVRNVYFSIINEHMGEQLRERAYYFFGLYHMVLNIALVSALGATVYSLNGLVIQLTRQEVIPVFLVAPGLLCVVGWAFSRRQSVVENYLTAAFEFQKQWVVNHSRIVEKVMCEPHRSSLALDK